MYSNFYCNFNKIMFKFILKFLVYNSSKQNFLLSISNLHFNANVILAQFVYNLLCILGIYIFY